MSAQGGHTAAAVSHFPGVFSAPWHYILSWRAFLD